MSTLQIFGVVVLVLFLAYGIARVRGINARAILGNDAVLVFMIYLACTAVVIAGALANVRLVLPAQLACVIAAFFILYGGIGAGIADGVTSAARAARGMPVAVPVQPYADGLPPTDQVPLRRVTIDPHSPRVAFEALALLAIFGCSAVLHAYVVLDNRLLG